MSTLERYIENMLSVQREASLKCENGLSHMASFAAKTAQAFLDSESTVKCKNRNCRKQVVNNKPLGRKKEYCDNKCRMAERSNRVKNKELK
ncbi:MAG: hypothetical protein ACRC0J_12395 [Shewanella oncorhynchi]